MPVELSVGDTAFYVYRQHVYELTVKKLFFCPINESTLYQVMIYVILVSRL